MLVGLGCLWLSFWIGRAEAQDAQDRAFNLETYYEKVADKLFICEGADSAKWPYGVKGYTWDRKDEARQVAINTVRNAHKVWLANKIDREFVFFLCDVWCPADTDAQGNINLKHNLKLLLSKP